jgi:L-asparagine transporter-like permease
VVVRIIAGLIGFVALAEGAIVAIGMVKYRDPEFERGTSPTWTVVMQETAGAITLITLAVLLTRLPQFARRRRVGGTLGLSLWVLILGAVWVYALILQRAS